MDRQIVSPCEQATMDSGNLPASNLPSYTQSQLEAWLQSLPDKKSTENYDAFLANLLPLAESKLGREVALEDLKQMVEGVLPVELQNYKTMSTPVATKKRMEPKKAQTLPMNSKMVNEPYLGGRGQIEKETITNDTPVTEASGDSDSEVEKKRIALREAMKNKAERKKNKSKTVDDIRPRPNQKLEGPDHQASSSSVTANSPFPWSLPPTSPLSYLPTPTTPTMGSPSAMSPGSHDSGNYTYTVTTDSYNDNSISITKRAGRKKKDR